MINAVHSLATYRKRWPVCWHNRSIISCTRCAG